VWLQESLGLGRKVFLTGLMCFFERGSAQQLVFGAVIAAIFLAASVDKRPFKTKFDNDFKVVTDAALMVTFNLSLLFSKEDESTSTGPVPLEVLSALLIIVNIIVPMGLVGAHIRSAMKKKHMEGVAEKDRENGPGAATFENPVIDADALE
jgi:uncharacterized membrane protein (UPF0136 family)